MKRLKKALLGLFLGILLVSYAHAENLSSIRTKIRRSVQDNPSDSARYRYTDAVLLDLINEGQLEIVNISWLAEKTSSYILMPRTSYYALPNDYMAVTQVYFADARGQTYELDEISQKALYDRLPDWEETSGTPVQYWVSPATNPAASDPAAKRVSYVPVPASQSTGTVQIWYVHQVGDMSADGDTPWDGRRDVIPYHNAIIFYVVMRIKEIEKKYEEAAIYEKRYVNAVNVLTDKIGRRPNYTPSMGAGGTR